MNIAQTRQVMAYLWATHPSAPKYTDDDKVRTIASYFRVLYGYSLEDVLDAVDRVCKKSPSFIPSAYEIEAACQKSANVEAFLPKEYHELDAQYKEFAYCYYQDLILARNEIEIAKTEEERAKAQARFDGIKARMAIEEKMHELYKAASYFAEEAYDRTQAQLAHNDLCSLGYERLALEG